MFFDDKMVTNHRMTTLCSAFTQLVGVAFAQIKALIIRTLTGRFHAVQVLLCLAMGLHRQGRGLVQGMMA